ncbi:hypothetical protein TSAR_016925 [Trichomalopsis sarcophagae]|uniref:Uncharacterized protein n=1 Tax=Trichomalopsis sarcophagae TaxID=543379 RepID=A0A232EIV5_9HYME|nr:hypothetical protein TSAR_016925 [Trichomalopsis sarcophagae]
MTLRIFKTILQLQLELLSKAPVSLEPSFSSEEIDLFLTCGQLLKEKHETKTNATHFVKNLKLIYLLEELQVLQKYGVYDLKTNI